MKKVLFILLLLSCSIAFSQSKEFTLFVVDGTTTGSSDVIISENQLVDLLKQRKKLENTDYWVMLNHNVPANEQWKKFYNNDSLNHLIKSLNNNFSDSAVNPISLVKSIRTRLYQLSYKPIKYNKINIFFYLNKKDLDLITNQSNGYAFINNLGDELGAIIGDKKCETNVVVVYSDANIDQRQIESKLCFDKNCKLKIVKI